MSTKSVAIHCSDVLTALGGNETITVIVAIVVGGALKNLAFLNAETIDRSTALSFVGLTQRRLRRLPLWSTLTAIWLSISLSIELGFTQFLIALFTTSTFHNSISFVSASSSSSVFRIGFAASLHVAGPGYKYEQ